jgi:hypothetical protein
LFHKAMAQQASKEIYKQKNTSQPLDVSVFDKLHEVVKAEAAASGAVAGRRLSSRFELNIFERIEANDPSVGARFGSGPHRAWMKEGWRRRQRARVFSAARAADLGIVRDGPTRRRCRVTMKGCEQPLCETHPDDQHNALRERARFCRFVLRRRGSRAGARIRGVMV